jgi:hypothetical protein
MKAAWILTLLMAVLALPGRAAGPDESQWKFNYPVPDEDVKSVVVTLSYRWWDPKVDGDLASKKVLLASTTVSITPGQKSIPIQVLLNGGKSVVIVGTQVFRGRGRLLDATFVRATEPQLNYNGFYVLAQQSSDPKKPAAMADSQSASAWIELGIEPKS